VVGTFQVYDENGDNFSISSSGANGTFSLTTIDTSTNPENGVVTQTVKSE